LKHKAAKGRKFHEEEKEEEEQPIMRKGSRHFAKRLSQIFMSSVLTMACCCSLRSAFAEKAPAPIPARPGFDFSVWETVPIQENGLEKSLFTVARDTVREMTGNANYGGRGPMENFFSMAFEAEKWFDEPILAVRQKDLKALFDKKSRISVAEFESKRADWMKFVDKDATNQEAKTEVNHLFEKAKLMETPVRHMNIIPTVDFRGDKTEWRSVEELASQTKNPSAHESRLIAAWEGVYKAFAENDSAAFNSASKECVAALGDLGVPMFKPEWKFKLDRWDAKVGLFRIAGWVYLISALFFLCSYLSGGKKASTMVAVAAGSTLALGVVLHVSALVIRGILAGRTPVANLFESATFIIGMMTVLSVIISTYYRSRVVGLAGATLGAFFMGIANNIPLQYGRKILPLVDALQSYWLHIHVTAMLTSYAFFALAFFVALCYVLRRIMLSRRGAFEANNDGTLQYLDGLNFRIITIGFPILTAGVILGAVWASEAWGRPWGFDPKETAAAMTWMIYALYLHFRLFMGWRGPKGVWLSVLGFGAVVFTYLGVSFFLPGLHSYVEKDGVNFFTFLKQLLPR